MFNHLCGKSELRQLEMLCNQIDANIKYVNSGGCCVCAAHIAFYLKEHFPTRLLVSASFLEEEDFGFRDVDVYDISNNIGRKKDHEEWNENGVYFGHVIVEFEHNGLTYHMDSTGVYEASDRDPTFGWPLYNGHLPLKSAKSLACNSSCWNHTFDRNQIPKLYKIINKFFKKFEMSAC